MTNRAPAIWMGLLFMAWAVASGSVAGAICASTFYFVQMASDAVEKLASRR